MCGTSSYVRPGDHPHALARASGKSRTGRFAPSRSDSGRRRYEAELQERPEPVGHAPMLDELAVDDPEHVEHVDLHPPARGRMPHEGPVMRAAAAHAQPDGIARHGEILDLQVEVRVRAVERRDDGLYALSTGGVVRPVVLVLDEVGRGHLVADLEAALVEPLLDQPPGDGLGIRCHSVLLLDKVILY